MRDRVAGRRGGRGLVGRQAVLRQLRAAVQAAARGRGRAVLLTGEAGIGKTAVASEVAAYAERAGARVLWSSAWQGPDAPDYWPWIQVLRGLLAGARRRPAAPEALSLPRLLAELGRPVVAAGGISESPRAARFQLFDATAGALEAAAAVRPIVLVLDDLHWADPSSVGLLHFLARRLRGTALLVVGTYRDAELREGGLAARVADLATTADVLPLSALSEPDVGRVMAGVMGGEPDADLVAAVHRRTGGNPFFVLQVGRLLQARPAAPDEPAGRSLPVEVREAVARRLARLSPACSALLAVAAVAGAEFRTGLLAEASGRTPAAVRDALREAAAAQVVVEAGSPLGPHRFVHDLVRETIADALSPGEAARLHLAVGRALERASEAGGAVSPAELAGHFAQAAGAGAAEEAFRYSALAARDAAGRLAYGESARHWQRALEVLEASPGLEGSSRAAVLLELGDALRRGGDARAARERVLRAAELARRAGDPRVLARAALVLHAIGVRSWPPQDELIEVLEEALAGLGEDVIDDEEEEGAALRSRVHAALARELAWSGRDLGRAHALVERAVGWARRAGETDPGRATLAASLLARHNVTWGPGNAGARLALVDEIEELAAAAGDRELLVEARLLRAADLLELGNPRFHAELDAFVQAADALRQPRLTYAAQVRRAMRALMLGELVEAERLIQAAAALGSEIGEPDAAGVRAEQLWELQSLRGRRLDMLQELPHAYPDDTVEMRWFLATARLERGDVDGARAASAPMLQIRPESEPHNRAWLPGMVRGADLMAAIGARDACEQLYEALAAHAEDAAAVGAAVAFLGAVAHHLGVLAAALGRPAEARAHFQRALVVHERLGARPWVLRTRGELARTLLAEPAARERALAMLADVAESAARLGMTELAAGADAARRDAQRAPAPSAVFRREGTGWALAFAGTAVRMKDAKGLADIAALLAAPGRPFSAADLVARGAAAARTGLRLGADEVLDAQARREFRDRLDELAEEIDEAERWSDPERASRARQEREVLLQELAAAAGLGGRVRRLGDQSERARKAVTARIRDVLARLEPVHPVLAEHLRASISTGTTCVYSPADAVAWQL